MEANNKSSSHAVYNLKLHIVFVTKYRRKTLTPELLDYLKKAFADCLTAWRCTLVESVANRTTSTCSSTSIRRLIFRYSSTTSRRPAPEERETVM